MQKLTAVKAISRLSFWRFVRLEKCLLSGAFPEFAIPKISERLPISKPQALGEIFHNSMEELNKIGGKTSGLADLEALFAKVIADYQEKEVTPNPRARHLGDIRLWGELASIYRALIDFTRREKDISESGAKAFAEKELRSKDGILTGRLDAYFLRGSSIRLVDYKSGVILQEGMPKQEYVRQLYLYAHLIQENHGIYPASMALIGRELKAIEIEPSQEGSEQIAREMRSRLALFNSKIEEGLSITALSQPSSDACTYCDAKPFCPAFWNSVEKIQLEGRNHIIDGVQEGEVISSVHGASSINLRVKKGSIRLDKVSIARFFPKRFPEFKSRPGQRLIISNLHYDAGISPQIASLTERSQIFELGFGQNE